MKPRQNMTRLTRFHLEEQKRHLIRLDHMIAEFKKILAQLEIQIRDEESKSGIYDINHFAYSSLAKAARLRCSNIQTSLTRLNEEYEATQELLTHSTQELSKAETLESRSNLCKKNPLISNK